MPTMLRISEAASLAMHAGAVLAGAPDKAIPTREIASTLKVSENHLEKVLQRLAKAGIVKGARGPGGGFRLSRSAGNITLQDIYEAIEGKITMSGCLLGNRECRPEECILRGLSDSVNLQVSSYFSRTTLESLAGDNGRVTSTTDN
jgi:Rrf2 family protein